MRQHGKTGRSVTILCRKVNRLFRSYRKKRLGAAAVEFAFVAPVFFLLVFGMIEFGRMAMVQQVITNASREGARRAVLDGATTTTIENIVNDYLGGGSITGAEIDVIPNPPSDAGHGEPVTVTVTIGFDEVSWLASPMFLRETNLSATTVMRRESVQ